MSGNTAPISGETHVISGLESRGLEVDVTVGLSPRSAAH